MQNTTLVTVRVKPDIAKRLEKLAELMDRSKSYLAAEAIEEYLDVQEWQVKAIKEGIKPSDFTRQVSNLIEAVKAAAKELDRKGVKLSSEF